MQETKQWGECILLVLVYLQPLSKGCFNFSSHCGKEGEAGRWKHYLRVLQFRPPIVVREERLGGKSKKPPFGLSVTPVYALKPYWGILFTYFKWPNWSHRQPRLKVGSYNTRPAYYTHYSYVKYAHFWLVKVIPTGYSQLFTLPSRACSNLSTCEILYLTHSKFLCN